MLATALGAGGAYGGSQLVPPVYRATTTLLADGRLARSVAARLTNRHVLEAVIESTGLGMTPEELERLVDVQLVPDTPLLELSVEHTNPATAVLIANVLGVVLNRVPDQSSQADPAYQADEVTPDEEDGSHLIPVAQEEVEDSTGLP